MTDEEIKSALELDMEPTEVPDALLQFGVTWIRMELEREQCL